MLFSFVPRSVCIAVIPSVGFVKKGSLNVGRWLSSAGLCCSAQGAREDLESEVATGNKFLNFDMQLHQTAKSNRTCAAKKICYMDASSFSRWPIKTANLCNCARSALKIICFFSLCPFCSQVAEMHLQQKHLWEFCCNHGGRSVWRFVRVRARPPNFRSLKEPGPCQSQGITALHWNAASTKFDKYVRCPSRVFQFGFISIQFFPAPGCFHAGLRIWRWCTVFSSISLLQLIDFAILLCFQGKNQSLRSLGRGA